MRSCSRRRRDNHREHQRRRRHAQQRHLQQRPRQLHRCKEPTRSAGSTGLYKTAAGTLTITNANSYTGGTTLAAGTLNINNTAALGAGSSSLTITGGTIDNTSGGIITLANNNPENWNGDFTFTGTNDLNLGTGDGGDERLANRHRRGRPIDRRGSHFRPRPQPHQGRRRHDRFSPARTPTPAARTSTPAVLSLANAGALGTAGTIRFGGGTLQYTSSNVTDYSARFSTADNQPFNIDTNGQDRDFRHRSGRHRRLADQARRGAPSRSRLQHLQRRHHRQWRRLDSDRRQHRRGRHHRHFDDQLRGARSLSINTTCSDTPTPRPRLSTLNINRRHPRQGRRLDQRNSHRSRRQR